MFHNTQFSPTVSGKFVHPLLGMLVILSLLILNGCASSQLIQSWREPALERQFEHLMIIGISDSQQTRKIYEDYFVSELKKRTIDAVPSYTLINSKQKIDRDTVKSAIAGTDIDAVLVTYLVSEDNTLKDMDSPLNGGYSTDSENLMSATLILNRGRSREEERITLKSDLYSVATKQPVWSAQTLSVAPESIDQVVTDVTSLLIAQMLSDGVIKPDE